MAEEVDEGLSDPEYICEWADCVFKTNESQELLDHVYGHKRDTIDGSLPDGPFVCQWRGCRENGITAESQFKLHLSFHAFHSKLMAWGSLVLEELNHRQEQNYICTLSSTNRNVLPEVPEYLICLWKDCSSGNFDDISSFFAHVEDHVKEDIPVIPTTSRNSSNIQSYTCLWTDCEAKIVGHRAHLRVHLRSHSQEKSISCPFCGSMFGEKYKFIDHIMRQYTKDVPPNVNTESNICNICCKEFASKRIYNEHLKNHNSTRKCPICGYVTRATSLNKHMLYRHSDERNFACDQCPSKFKTLSDLRKHLVSHTGASVFECEECPFVARSRGSLKTHRKKAHGLGTGDTYKCHLCEVNFQRANSLTRHLSRKHEISLPQGKSRFKFKKHADGLIRAVIDWM